MCLAVPESLSEEKHLISRELTSISNADLLEVFTKSINAGVGRKNIYQKDLKIGSDYKNILLRIIESGPVSVNIKNQIEIKSNLFQNIIRKKFIKYYDEKNKPKKSPILTIAILSGINLMNTLRRLKENDVEISENKLKCYRQVFRNNNGEIKNITMILNGDLTGEYAKSCVLTLFFYSFFPGESVSSQMKNKSENQFRLYEIDFLNLRILYNDSTPKTYHEIYLDEDMLSVINQSKEWILDCKSGLNGCGGEVR